MFKQQMELVNAQKELVNAEKELVNAQIKNAVEAEKEKTSFKLTLLEAERKKTDEQNAKS